MKILDFGILNRSYLMNVLYLERKRVMLRSGTWNVGKHGEPGGEVPLLNRGAVTLLYDTLCNSSVSCLPVRRARHTVPRRAGLLSWPRGSLLRPDNHLPAAAWHGCCPGHRVRGRLLLREPGLHQEVGALASYLACISAFLAPLRVACTTVFAMRPSCCST